MPDEPDMGHMKFLSRNVWHNVANNIFDTETENNKTNFQCLTISKW
jgi:hypothetical protein